MMPIPAPRLSKRAYSGEGLELRMSHVRFPSAQHWFGINNGVHDQLRADPHPLASAVVQKARAVRCLNSSHGVHTVRDIALIASLADRAFRSDQPHAASS